jgi:hypothetical protein
MGPTRATLWPLENLIRDQVGIDVGERKPRRLDLFPVQRGVRHAAL